MPALPADDSRPCAEGQEQEKQPETAGGCSVYVGNLAWGVRTEELRDHMAQAGEVLRVEVFEDYQGRSKGCGIVVYKDDDCAQRAIKELTDSVLQDRPIFVREDREEGGKFPGGRGRGRGRGGYSGGRGAYQGGGGGSGGGGGGGGYQGGGGGGGALVSGGGTPYQGSGGSAGGGASGGSSRQVFVSNLPWKTSWHDLKDLFRECGEVVRADVMEMPNGRSKGVGTVLFVNHESAQNAIETFNNYILEGRHISVRFDRKEF